MSGLIDGLKYWCLDVLKGDPITAVPTAGLIGLVVGIVLAIKSRRWRLVAFAAPLILSFSLAYLPDCFRGHLTDRQFDWLLGGMLLVQAVVLAYLFLRFKDARWAAFSLAVFGMCVTLMEAAGAEMAFTGMWI